MIQGEPPYLALPPTKVKKNEQILVGSNNYYLFQKKALLYITTRGVPPIRCAEDYSPLFQSFLLRCVNRDRRLRPSAEELLKVHYMAHSNTLHSTLYSLSTLPLFLTCNTHNAQFHS